jgi:hypothetical protein
MRSVALSIVVSCLLCLISFVTVTPATAGDYYDGDGYYGRHRHNYYRSSSCCDERIVRSRRVDYDEPYYRPHRTYYEPSYRYRSSYYEPSHRYYSSYASSSYGDSCHRRKIYDQYGGWVWGQSASCF